MRNAHGRLHGVLILLALGTLLSCAESDPGTPPGPRVDGDAEAELAPDGDNDGEGAADTFPPESQTAFLTKGLIMPRNSFPCTPAGSSTVQTRCNHHASSIAEEPDGSLAVVWYTGVEEKSLDSKLAWSRRSPNATEWTAPVVLYDDPAHSEGNPTIFVDEAGIYYVFFATIIGAGWDSAEIRLLRSSDGGKNWGTALALEAPEKHFNVRHRPLVLGNGDWLLPLYHESFGMPIFLRSADRFTTWNVDALLPNSGTHLVEHAGQIQPALIRLDGIRVAALTRDGLLTHRIKRMVSADNGQSWSKSLPTELPNSGTGIDQVKLLDGHVVVVFNNHPTRRFPLNVALSEDGGETFVAMRTLHEDNQDCDTPGDCAYHYPSIIQSRHDGTIWVSYTHNRETIGWVHFNEAWLKGSKETLLVSCGDNTACYEETCLTACDKNGACAQGTCKDGTCLVSCSKDGDCTANETCTPSGHCRPKQDETRLPYHCLP